MLANTRSVGPRNTPLTAPLTLALTAKLVAVAWYYRWLSRHERERSSALELLQNTLELLAFDTATEPEAEPDAEVLGRAADYLFLQRKLSRREMDIAREVCSCLSNKQIGEKLFISETTVKSHISNILAKMGMKDRMQLVMFCREQDRE